MRSWFIIFVVVLLQLFALSGRGQAGSPPEGFRSLFNEKDLTGWFGLNPHSVAKLSGDKKEAKLKAMREEFATHWRVEGDELVNDGHGPYAATDKDYGDMELHLEYKTVAKADSGIYLRGTPQVQIWDKTQIFNPDKPTRRPHLGSGGLFNNDPASIGRDPLNIADRPFGKWNQLKIRQIGDRTWVWLNDKPVVPGVTMENYWDRSKKLPATGPIMLQTHGGEIRWRNIYIREYSETQSKHILSISSPMLPDPTEADVSYGPHHKQKLHFWKAASDQPTPLLYFIHGGGWRGGNRMSGLTNDLNHFLDNGISVVSVEYRFIPEATADGESPPVKGPLYDAARALQFVRSKAETWNIDKDRIGASGGSAGACSSLWLAFHPDLADPKSDDPVARESTRLHCAAVNGAQTTLDPFQMREWTPNSRYGGHAFGFKTFSEFYGKRDTILPWIAEYSPYANVSSDDPPVYLNYRTPPRPGQEEKDPTHTANFGINLKQHCKKHGVTCEFYYPGVEDPGYTSARDYLVAKLKKG